MSAHPFLLNGAELEADPAGALWWPAKRTLVVADLHLEKGSHLALPPYDTLVTIERLERLVAARGAERLIALGDSFHDRGAAGRMPAEWAARLARLVQPLEWIWIAGNHDPAPAGPWGGRVTETLVLGPLLFRHEAAPAAAPGEVSGHFHPKATVRQRGRTLSARCFATDGRRLVLPAFGAYAGGLDLLDPALRRLFGPRLDAFLLGRSRVVRMSL